MNLLLSDEFRERAIQFIAWTLVHAGYQCFVIALVVWVSLRATKASAQVRYLLGCGGLLLMLILPCATVWLTQAPRPLLPGPSASPSPVAVQSTPVVTAWEVQSQILNKALPAPPPPAPAMDDMDLEFDVPRWMTWLVVAWLVGAVGFAAHLTLGLLGCQRLLRRDVQAMQEPWLTRMPRLARQMGLRRPPRVLLSSRALGPMVVGCLKPCILLPVSMLTQLTPAQVELVLLHELAHIRRLDLWVNLLQAVVETLLFFHPGVWWLSRQVRTQREICCDEAVLTISQSAHDYAQVLYTLAASRQTVVLGAAGGSLRLRIEHILNHRAGAAPTGYPRRATMHWLGIGSAMVALLLGLWLQVGPQLDDWLLKRRMHELLESANPPMTRAIVLGLDVGWQSSDWAGAAHTPAARSIDASGGVKLSVFGRDVSHVWMRPLRQPIDLGQYPMVALRYRATPLPFGTALRSGYVLWGDDGTGPVAGGQALVTLKDLELDGREHVLVKDFSATVAAGKIRGPLTSLAMRVHGYSEHLTHLEIIDFRFMRSEEGAATATRPAVVRVLDSNGRPLPQANVRSNPERRNAGRIHRTDASGQATLSLPRDEPARLFVQADGYADTEIEPTPDAEQIEVIMEPAAALSGMVLDDAGRPLAGAVVELILADQPQRPGQHVQRHVQLLSDEQGRWQSNPLALHAGTLYAAVSFPGLAPHLSATALQAAPPRHDLEPIPLHTGPNVDDYRQGKAQLVLKPGVTLRGRVIGNEQPITAVQLEALDGTALTLRATIEPDGSFTLNHAPPGPAFLVVHGKEMPLSMALTLPNRGEDELVVALDKAQHQNTILAVRGRVIDVRTRQPIEHFDVTLAHVHRMDARGTLGSMHMEPRTRQACRDGIFTARAVKSGLPTVVHIEAEGYEPAASRAFLKHEGAQVWDVALTPRVASP